MIKAGAISPTSFVPNQLGAVRKQFGKSATDLIPAEGVDPNGAQFLAAQLQHRISNAVRESILSSGTNLASFSERHRDAVPGLSYDRLVRMLRGETQVQLADVIAWAQLFPAVRALLLDQKSWQSEVPGLVG